MDKKDEQLLQQFFTEASRQTVANNGFSDRVLRRLPLRVNWFGRLWTLGCLLAAAIVILESDALTVAVVNLEIFVCNLLDKGLTEILITVGTLGFGLAVAGGYELFTGVKEEL